MYIKDRIWISFLIEFQECIGNSIPYLQFMDWNDEIEGEYKASEDFVGSGVFHHAGFVFHRWLVYCPRLPQWTLSPLDEVSSDAVLVPLSKSIQISVEITQEGIG